LHLGRRGYRGHRLRPDDDGVSQRPKNIIVDQAPPRRMAVRASEPGGPAGYESALRADLAARKSAGAELLKNSRIRFTAQDAAQLRAGAVDSGCSSGSRRWRPSTRSGWLRSAILPPASRFCSGT
jgi:hypothetical protein